MLLQYRNCFMSGHIQKSVVATSLILKSSIGKDELMSRLHSMKGISIVPRQDGWLEYCGSPHKAPYVYHGTFR